jgi:Mg2+-importing ATPase
VRLSAGDLVPADAILLESRDLFVQQAALTGESLPAEKEANGETPSMEAESRHMLFLGTSVVSGSATARVVETGSRTGFGEIAAGLQSRHQETAFDRGLRDFRLFLARTVLFLVIFLVVVRIAFHRGALESVLFAVALAVGLTPEFLPMITAITLGKGALAMARKKVIVKHGLGKISVHHKPPKCRKVGFSGKLVVTKSRRVVRFTSLGRLRRSEAVEALDKSC